MKSNWSREKEILKLLIVLLPISLYLLQVIVTVSGLESVSLTTGTTALGWFLEILFVYLTTFIFSIELLASSRIALKGRSFGETIRNQTFKSLYTVGAPISILSVILYVVQYRDNIASITIVIYFFCYFIMASLIFIFFLKLFEPISLLIFARVMQWWKRLKEKKLRLNSRNVIYVMTYGVIAVLAYILINLFVFGPLYVYLFPDYNGIIASARFDQSSSLLYAFGFDLMDIYNFLTLIALPLFLSSIFLIYGLRKMNNMLLGYVVFLTIIVGTSIVFINIAPALINFSPDDYWITGQNSYTSVFGFIFFIFRTAGLDANLSGLLGFLSIPYVYTRYIFNIIIWSLILYYLKKSFKTKNIPVDENNLEKVVYSSVDEIFAFADYNEGNTKYMISKNLELASKDLEFEREEIKNIMNNLETDTLLLNLIPAEQKERERFYFTLKYLFNNGFIEIYKPEFSYTFEKVEKQGLYIIYEDGRGVFDYSFMKEYSHDPGLISGMFSAITSFIKETTKSQELLKTIDHGDITILIEYGKKIFGALFIKGKPSVEVRTKLSNFVHRFEGKYEEVLEDWSGALIHFKEDHKLVEDIFKEE
jgi:hypothetical protein